MNKTLNGKLPITIVIICLNEEANILKLLPTLSFADQVVVVDSGSVDNTKNVALSFDCSFYHKEFNGYGDQKRFAVSMARNEWVLNLDADEIPSVELIEDLLQCNFIRDKYVAYSIRMDNRFLGHKVRQSFLGNQRTVRFFNKKFADFSTDRVHEKVLFNGACGTLNGHINHESYQSYEHYLYKFNEYTSLAASANKNKKYSPFVILGKSFYKFFDFFLLKGNFLEGYYGFVWSFLASYYVAVKLLKSNFNLTKTSN